MASQKPPDDYLKDLNPPQREAVTHTGGPLLVVAGAGSGKTRVLTYRIAHLLAHHDVKPWNILALTFTNKAAGEMADRVEGLVGVTSRTMMIGTFHSACARLLRSEIEPLGFSSGFSIYDEADSLRVITRCLEDLGLDRKSYHPKALKAVISRAKNEMVDEESFASGVGNIWEEVCAQVYAGYQERLKASDALDFDDLILVPVHLFELYPEVLAKYRERYQHVLVDEYQDTNLVQYRMVKMLAGEHRRLTVVGDDDQGIYSWRGADIRNILEFEKDYPDARVIKLEQNYRSTPEILTAAGAVIRNNRDRKEKTLWTGNRPGARVRYFLAENEHSEAAFVCDQVKELVEDGLGYNDQAVFYRTHAQSRVVEEALIRQDIPYRIFGGTRFYERREIKDILAYLRVMANPRDDVSLSRIVNVPPRGIGRVTMSGVEDYARSNGIYLRAAISDYEEIPGLSARGKKSLGFFLELLQHLESFAGVKDVDELIREVWTATGYMAELEAQRTLEAESRIENLKELLGVVEDFKREYGAAELGDFLERVSLVGDTDDLDTEGGYVSLMTLHNAKGLEFPVVYIVGMEEGVFPHVRSMEEPGDIEEERRLCYVGMTRARRYLYTVHAASRSLWGGVCANPISRFLAEMPSDLLEEVEWVREPAEEREVLELETGEEVVHAKWGPGTVIEVVELDGDFEVVVDFPGTGRKRLLLSYAPLSRPD